MTTASLEDMAPLPPGAQEVRGHQTSLGFFSIHQSSDSSPGAPVVATGGHREKTRPPTTE